MILGTFLCATKRQGGFVSEFWRPVVQDQGASKMGFVFFLITYYG